MRETLEQFLARGGQIEHPQPRPFDDRPSGIEVMRKIINDARFTSHTAKLAGRASGEARRYKSAVVHD